ncbi:hypothetical protein VOLCADRAFT_106212 [Volvox carteri f. nagariensis]|uniref:DJ-1/PfpI domain-containing protein n=1 Tax=Volvox carteri f. nagariensis TaxID=3068 RepID=D8U5V3_VOLCA|nr:uncharacterized protein VOLCADRAFT_106212 [Volvox carteri f. nagariensis]EFJ44752.1 hypothetical protein VOLCADRAFT_106212 [Volvox carteri f. nagariensis]|eukprot:XP_002954035.1 hypothetical protein VOLCADRAFT_106212 [Volvox carteri f. nagariensis]
MHEHELMKNAVVKGQVLLICTSCSSVGNRKDTGVWLSEVAVPYYIFRNGGYDVTLCSLAGGEIPVDQAGLTDAEKARHPELGRFLADEAAMLQLRESVAVSSVKQPAAYDCIFLAGGQGAMGDMPHSSELATVVGEAAMHGRLVAAVCHGPAGLLGAKDADGKPLVAGKTIACFSQAEEEKTGAAGSMPFQLESKLKELGANVCCADINEENALRDGVLVTGQNHNSVARVAKIVLEALSLHPAGAEDLSKVILWESQGASAALNPKIIGDSTSQLEFRESSHARAAPSLKGERERVNAGDLLQTSSRSSWDEWLKHFDTMDELAEDAAHYQIELNTAVRQEQYGDAARFKRKLQEIQSSDTVASVQRQLQEALATEQYGAAADLRDRGLVGLAGWWAGKDGPEDFQGHLLHVKPEFGRWTGRIYMARDIAAMNGWRENKLVQLLDRATDRNAARGTSASGGLGSGTIGTPMLEVFVRQQQQQQPATDGQGVAAAACEQQQQQLVPNLLVHQAVALRPPAAKAAGGGKDARSKGSEGADADATKGGATQLNPASVVRLSIHVARDGSARISVLPPKPIKSEFSSWEEEEMRAAMAALAGDGPKPAAPRGNVGSRPSGGAAALGSAKRPNDDDDEDGDEDDVLTELTRIPAQVAMQGRDRFTFTVLEQEMGDAARAVAVAAAGVDNELIASSGSSVDLSRWAAVPIDEDDSSGDDIDTSAESQRRTAASATSAVTVDAPVVEVELQLPDIGKAGVGTGGQSLLDAADEAAAAARAADADDDDEDDRALSVSFDMLSTGYGKLDAVATSVSDAEEQRILIEIPVGRLIRQQQREAEEHRRLSGAGAGTSAAAGSEQSKDRASKDTFDRLAERVAQLQAARAGRRVPPEHLATALRTLAQRLVNGELAADGSSSATATVPSPAAIAAQKAAAAAAARLQAASSPASVRSSSSSSSPTSSQLGATRISYARIPTDLPRSDPFCGLYLGAFGPHGPELIQLSRTMQDGEEVVCATKVTGDPNVPAGEVSFRAKVGRRHRLDSRDVYPDELGIVARYKGEGRVAMAGYKSPRWVDGELLVFAVGASPVTGGAELGFVWSVPGEKRFLILLNKLDLKECENFSTHRCAARPPERLVAVVNRDVEGAVLVDAAARRFDTMTASDCRDACVSTPGCNLWVFCPVPSGCASTLTTQQYNDLETYRQCWLKYDNASNAERPATNRPPWPRVLNLPNQDTGWMSGTTEPGVQDSAGVDWGVTFCTCTNYTMEGYRFRGVCASFGGEYTPEGLQCLTNADCANPPSLFNGTLLDSCDDVFSCTVLLDTELQGKVIQTGTRVFVGTPEACCALCAKTQYCNTWSWCGDPRGCPGLERFRECVLKSADPENPVPGRGGFGNSTGWMSGVRLAWMSV